MIDSLAWLFLESPLALGALSALVLFWLLVHWRRGGSRRPLLCGLAVCGALLIAQALIETTREQVGRVMARIEGDILLGRAGALQASLAPGFVTDLGGGPVDRIAFVAYAKGWLERVAVSSLTRTELKATPGDDGRLEVQLSYLAHVRYRDYVGLHPSSWRIRFAREGGELRIVEIEPVSIGGAIGAGWAALRE